MSQPGRLRVRIANRRRGGLWWRGPLIVIAWLLMAAPVVMAVAAIGVLRDYAAGLPRIPDLEAWERTVARTTVIVAADGAPVAEIPFQVGAEVGHRYPVRYRELPEALIHAVLAAEDLRFFEHRGVDARAVIRAAWANYQAGRVVEGASTLTQQVARNLLPADIGHERTLRRKVREALLARRIEQRYPKKRIFEVYVNHAFLGAGAYGVAAAARAYFSKRLDQLELAESALIAGLAQAPGRADPYRDIEAARARRDQVLDRMLRAGFIDDEAHRAATAAPIELAPPAPSYGTLAPWHTERVRQHLAAELPDHYRRGGLRVETSALSAISIEAEAAARRWSERLGQGRANGAPQLGALLWDHRTGYVEAVVGGVSWAESRFDRATQACRQPGSAFKPILYAAAIEHDVITPGTPLRDAPIATYDEDEGVFWKPTNSGRSFRGVALAHEALVSSLNAPAVDVLDRVGGARVIDLARRLGIRTEIADVRPMALGASCVVPLELAGAFAALANRGRAVEPVFAVRVSRGDRVLLDRASPHDPGLDPARRLDRLAATAGASAPAVLDEASAYLVSAMLRDVVARGTATAARRLDRDAAGKTGTTNDNTDAWFVGYTGRLVGAVWIGHDDASRTLGPRDDGGRGALPLWIELVGRAEAGRPPVPVPGEVPADLERHRIDRETGLLARPGAGGATELYFKPGTAPVHQAGHIDGVPADLGRLSREF